MSRSDIHVHVTSDYAAILDRLNQMEINIMSALTDAIAAQTAAITDLSGRIDADVAHLQELLAAALATDAADAATIASLQADADAAVASITASTSALTSIDPLPDFPEAPPVEPAP
jgi:uncharacterized protein (DUF1800 family)